MTNSLKSTDNLPPPHVLECKYKSLVFIDDLAVINENKVSVGFYYYSENLALNDLAIDKILAFFDLLMEDCIIIKKENTEKVRAIIANNVLSTPYAPSDQLVGSLLYSKISAIAGDDLLIDYISIKSDLGRDIRYTINLDSPELGSLLPDKEEWWGTKDFPHNPWWNRDDTATYDKLLEDNEIYRGEFSWGELFKDEMNEAAQQSVDPKKNRFQIIKGGKNEG